MSTPGVLTCVSCQIALAPGTAFCTRCGAAAPAVTVLSAPVTAGGQQWGGSRRRAPRARDVPSGSAPGRAPTSASALATVVRPSVALQTHTGPGLSVARSTALGPAFGGVIPAGTARRVTAYALDLGVVLAVGALVLLLTRSAVVAGLAVAEVAVGLVVWEARSGRTIGNTVLGLRSAKAETPYAPGLGRAVVRATVLTAGHLVAGVGQWLVVASSALDRSGRGQSWHDRAGRTVVVDIRAVPAPDDEPLPSLRSPAASAGSAPTAQPMPVQGVVAPEVPEVSAVPVAPPVPGPFGAVPSAVPVDAPPPTSAPTAEAPHSPAAPQSSQIPAAYRQGPSLHPVQPSAGPVAPATVTPVRSPDRPAPTPVPARPATSYVVTLDTGLAMTVSGPGYVGRRPQPPAGERCDHVIAIDDPGRSLSRTHARFGIDAGGFWVEDNGSANGTSVVSPDGSTVDGAPGERLAVPAGGTVRLGDRTFTVDALALTAG